MEQDLKEQLKILQFVIKAFLKEDKVNTVSVDNLMGSQKTLLECLLLAKHIEQKGCSSDGCSC